MRAKHKRQRRNSKWLKAKSKELRATARPLRPRANDKGQTIKDKEKPQLGPTTKTTRAYGKGLGAKDSGPETKALRAEG